MKLLRVLFEYSSPYNHSFNEQEEFEIEIPDGLSQAETNSLIEEEYQEWFANAIDKSWSIIKNE